MFSGQARGNTHRLKCIEDRLPMTKQVAEEARALAYKSDYADPFEVKKSAKMRKYLFHGNMQMALSVVDACKNLRNADARDRTAVQFVQEGK